VGREGPAGMTMQRILYVDALDYDSSPRIAAALRELGDVFTDGPLSGAVVERVRKAMAGTRPFTAVVSHLPFGEVVAPEGEDPFSWPPYKYKLARYGGSCLRLQEIRRITDIPIVVYTGAQQSDIPWSGYHPIRADALIHKRDEGDGVRLQDALRAAWILYANMPPYEPFRCESDGTRTWMESLIRNREGERGHYFVCKLWNALNALESVTLEWIGSDGRATVAFQPKTEGGINVMELIAFVSDSSIANGARVRIRVAGIGEEVESALRGIHDLINFRHPH
jgi:hypothetical protein